MASSSLTVWCQERAIRVFGGNRSTVRSAKRYYERMTLDEFLLKHPTRTKEDYETLQLSTRFNKK